MNPHELVAEVIERFRGMWRYRWWAVAASWLLFTGGALYIYSMADVYRAAARVFIDTNSLLGPMTEGLTAQQDTLSEVQLMTLAMFARPNLERIAEKIQPGATAQESERLVRDLQNNLQITGSRDNIFTIEYESTRRERAIQFVTAAFETFVTSSMGNQEEDVTLTEQALASEIEAHEVRLREAEAALANFKKENIGYMPDAAGGYYERLQAALAAVKAKEEQIRLLTERAAELRRQMESGVLLPADSATPAGCSQRDQITAAQGELDALRLRYRDRHPRLAALRDRISQLEALCVEELAAAARTTGATSQELSLEFAANPIYQNMRIQLTDTEVDLAAARAELESHLAVVEQLRRDVDKIAEVETQLQQLNRDYEVVYGRHQEYLSRWETLQAMKRLEPVTDQRQFRRFEPPFAEFDPVGPNRPLLLGVLLVVAVAAGVALTFGLNQVAPSFFSQRALQKAAALPVLGSISMHVTAAEVWARRGKTAAVVLMYAMLIAAGGAAVALERPGSTIVRALLEGTMS